MKSQVTLVRCKGYEKSDVDRAVRTSLELLGGIKKFVKPGAKVLVKPNLLMAIEPEKGITTHKEIVRAVIGILKELDLEILLGDSPSVWGKESENIENVFEKTGMNEIADEFKIRLVHLNNPRWHKRFPLTKYLDEVDCFISLPKLKTHSLTILTGAIKNLFGLVPGTYKTELHKRYFNSSDFSEILVEIYKEAPPTLSIVDAVVAMEGEGPGTSGRLRNLGLVLASSDAVALDSILSSIIGLAPEAVLTTNIAAKMKLGISDLGSIEVLGENLHSLGLKPFSLPMTSINDRIPQPLINIVNNFIKFYPDINKEMCKACQACLKKCPNSAITVKFEAIKIDYSKCLSCFCCLEICPHSAIRIKKSLLAKMLKL